MKVFTTEDGQEKFLDLCSAGSSFLCASVPLW